MATIFLTLLVFLIKNIYGQQLVSPCPRLFQYEPRNNENDRVYAQITLLSDADLEGVWLRVVFDKPSIQLGNWFGEVLTVDNHEYLIMNSNYRLVANTPLKLRFYIKYNPNEAPPQLVSFQINAETVCPERDITTEAPSMTGQLFISSELSTTSNPLNVTRANFNTVRKLVYGEQLVSPCPRLFQYEPINNENDRWYGQIILLHKADLEGVWVRVILDKPSIHLGNWFGEVVTKDNKEYLIKNRNHRLIANTPLKLRFYIKYNPNETPPQLVSFRLNAKTVCPEGGVTTQAPTTTGQLLTSSELSTTSNPTNFNEANLNTFVRPGGGFNPSSQGGDDDDYFRGDFAILGKPQQNVLDAACGVVIKQPKPLITHGQATQEGEFPWHAALYHAKNIDLTYICGASLISKYHLITVAHCVTRQKSQNTLSPGNLVVYLGKFYLKTWSNPGVQDKQVEKIIVHPKYSSQTFSNDIAVLRLKSAADITDYVRPICLWEGQVALEAVIGKPGTVVGWGYDESGKVTEQLTKAFMPVVSQETCIYSFPDFYSRFTSDHTFCAGYKNGTSVCNGDSGGGLAFPKAGAGNGNTIWQLRGLVSISVALQNQFRCDSMHYVVFTDVAKYLDWIKTALTM